MRWNPVSSTKSGAAILLCAALPALTGCGSAPSAPEETTAPVTTTTTATVAQAPTPLAAAPTVDPYAGLTLVDHVEWTEGVDGARLLVFPTEAGRQTTFPGSDERAWQEVLGQSADADSPGMRDQFICHWDWARLVSPNKPSWNLEPWRPAVGHQATVQASCNPGGPER
ncbi:DUF2599 domain-containing protein [Nocardia australiensis]|uniref:DUF2599 domain-containing protein n=1 Tax=Nocardia australiensis TaxID=2887191 RepID=UPI001D13F309|nr:DUF2599 domain-containing protein [Nocardia australiensis]